MADDAAEQRLQALLTRRSVSPKRLREPAPDSAMLDLMLQAALRAPDHGDLKPWRVIEFPRETRPQLARLFEDEKRRRDPLVGPADLRRAADHALHAPMMLGFVVAPRLRAGVPQIEQWLAAGAALGNLLNAAHELGYGAIMLSGERCHDRMLLSELGLANDEWLAGFVTIGTIAQAPPEARTRLSQQFWRCWSPRVAPTLRPSPQGSRSTP
ncbi:MAG: nitroreductase [Proteobacteria bacterium]|nr:nitroreductase [Pseudomonadota bacterium]